jgi:hypothetical protein
VFLEDLIGRPVADRGGWRGAGLFVGSGQLALEVVAYRSDAKPNAGDMQAAWRDRRGNRGAPVLVVVLHGDNATLAGPSGEHLPILSGIDEGTADRLCRAALDQPDRHAALQFLNNAMPSLETAAPGLRNEGLFALHELTNDVPRRAGWAEHVERSHGILAARPTGADLLNRLGFTVERLDNMTQVLKGADRRLALAVLLERTDVPEAGSPKFGNLSPVSYALYKADKENLDWVVVVQGDDRLRLYPTSSDKGVGRRGRSETYVELQTSVLPQDRLGYLTLLFSADALQKDGSVDKLLQDSKRFASSLADRLRDRIYNDVVPMLAQAAVQARNLTNPTAEQLDLTYRMALTILFRLLFVAYAEDRDLLPYRHSEAYRRRSLKQKAQELAEQARALTPPTPGTSHWDEVVRIWTAIERGDQELSVPPYNGGLFTRNESVSKAGAALAQIRLPNELFEPALQKLLLSDVGDDGFQPVDFRSLGVREFGTIYEGLLESELSVADQDLMLDARGSYVPVRGAAPPVVTAGEVYLHNRSGARKASGSYFTKHFAVEHLLDRALVPALEDHLARVSQLDEASAAEAFFDFRVADIAMGSGHFLVAAVDRIEKAFTDYLAQDDARGAAGVRNELARLREQAKAQLKDMAEQMAFEDSQLLRRLIARRCIYGVDQNPLSVQLARLAIWIHTFVPGLPLSVLDHNLVQGNSLVGIGTVREIEEKFEEAGTVMFPVDAQTLLAAAAQPLRRLANIADATLTDVEQAREAMTEAKLAVADTKALCDIITAQRLDPAIEFQFDQWERERATVQRSAVAARARRGLDGLEVFHFPIEFPEVFLRRRSGFDVLLGNPPWEKMHVEEHEFWSRHYPGLRALSPRELERRLGELRDERGDLVDEFHREVEIKDRIRAALTSGASYPGMGSGHPDLFKAFSWRYWFLLATGGRIGIVLPRVAWSAKGSELFRHAVFNGSSSVELITLANTRRWVFSEIDPRYTVTLAAIEKGKVADGVVQLGGPFSSLESLKEGLSRPLSRVHCSDVLSWNESASLPLLPASQSLEVFLQLRRAPNFGLRANDWDLRPEQEINAVSQKAMFDLESEEQPEGFWPVYKGESFDLWDPDTGRYNGFIDPAIAIPWLLAKRRNGARRTDGPHAGTPIAITNDSATLACNRPRIAFRDVTNRTNQRTVIACLIPPLRLITHSAPYLLRRRGDEKLEAYVVGAMSSRIFDWYARRIIEGHLTFALLNQLPLPRPEPNNVLFARAVALAGRLAAQDERFADWADAVGVECGRLDPHTKQDMIDELDAVVAHLYGLSAGQLTHIFETFHEGWDYQPRLDAVLAHFQRQGGIAGNA